LIFEPASLGSPAMSNAAALVSARFSTARTEATLHRRAQAQQIDPSA
jgi:hypothetical protein